MKTYGGVDVRLQAFVISVLDVSGQPEASLILPLGGKPATLIT
jgi:hypothetical protein